MLWPINRQLASLGPKGLRKSTTYHHCCPLNEIHQISLDHPNMDVWKCQPKSVTDLRSSSKGRPWGSSDLWRSRYLKVAMREKPLNSECPVPIEKFFHLGGCLFASFFGIHDVPTVDAHRNPAITTCYLWNPMKNGFHIFHINWWSGFLLMSSMNVRGPIKHGMVHGDGPTWLLLINSATESSVSGSRREA